MQQPATLEAFRERAAKLLSEGVTREAVHDYLLLTAQLNWVREQLESKKTQRRARDALAVFERKEALLHEEVEAIARDYEQLTGQEGPIIHAYRRRALLRARDALRHYQLDLEERLNQALRADRHQGLRDRFAKALATLSSPEANPKRPRARELLRELKEELLDIATTSPQQGPLRDEVNEAYRLASMKYDAAETSYRKRFYLKAGSLVAGLAAAGFLTLAIVRNAAYLRAPRVLPAPLEAPREPGKDYYLYVDEERHAAILYQRVTQEPLPDRSLNRHGLPEALTGHTR